MVSLEIRPRLACEWRKTHAQLVAMRFQGETKANGPFLGHNKNRLVLTVFFVPRRDGGGESAGGDTRSNSRCIGESLLGITQYAAYGVKTSTQHAIHENVQARTQNTRHVQPPRKCGDLSNPLSISVLCRTVRIKRLYQEASNRRAGGALWRNRGGAWVKRAWDAERAVRLQAELRVWL